MNHKLVCLGLCSLLGTLIGAAQADAGLFGHWGCHRHSLHIKCRPYNAFTPVCYGNLVCDGGCGIAGFGNGGGGHFFAGLTSGYSDGCYAGSCYAGLTTVPNLPGTPVVLPGNPVYTPVPNAPVNTTNPNPNTSMNWNPALQPAGVVPGYAYPQGYQPYQQIAVPNYWLNNR